MRVPEFTAAECRVVRLISLGLSTKQVAKVLGKAVSTIDNQRTSAMRSAEISTATQLVRVALLAGVTTLQDELTTEESRLAGEVGQRAARKRNSGKRGSKAAKRSKSRKSRQKKGTRGGATKAKKKGRKKANKTAKT